MKIFRTLLIILIAALVIWIDLPENVPLRFNTGPVKVNTVINPLRINANIFGATIQKDFKTHLGLDLKGGSHLVFEADVSKLKSTDVEDAINAARDIIEKRVNFFGVSEPSIAVSKSASNYRINVDLPGIENVQDAVRLIGSTARLEFKEVEVLPAKDKNATPSAVLKDTKLTGRDVKKATPTFDQQNGKPQVTLAFTPAGTKLFADITKRNVGKPVVILLDNAVLTQPVVQQAITDGNAVITGEFSVEDAKKLAIAINSGALPVPIKLIEQRNIGPTLGAIEVQKSVYAGLVGLAAVMLFMILYYGRLGLIACLALLIYGLLSFALFRAIPVVLTLSGIAGFILSIGMAVDSNILIFERIKEERRKGQDLDIAIRLGFGRALDAIKDANFTTLLVAFILFNPLNWDFFPQFGLIRGFALTLAIGVAMSLFTGVFITRHLIKFFYRK